ncbi:MAG TPA: hypothetical protein VFG21_03020 [Xanthomonadaceae bacterium]|nr:hypothetical protein [Xanthomonadaceae bacterium]
MPRAVRRKLGHAFGQRRERGRQTSRDQGRSDRHGDQCQRDHRGQDAQFVGQFSSDQLQPGSDRILLITPAQFDAWILIDDREEAQ